jgi:hypothetical protein
MTDDEVKRLHMLALSYAERGLDAPAWLKARTSVCNECEQPQREWYYLRNDVWKIVNPVRHGHLCLSCLAKRLGRPLTRKDFGQQPSDEDGNPIPLWQ